MAQKIFEMCCIDTTSSLSGCVVHSKNLYTYRYRLLLLVIVRAGEPNFVINTSLLNKKTWIESEIRNCGCKYVLHIVGSRFCTKQVFQLSNVTCVCKWHTKYKFICMHVINRVCSVQHIFIKKDVSMQQCNTILVYIPGSQGFFYESLI